MLKPNMSQFKKPSKRKQDKAMRNIISTNTQFIEFLDKYLEVYPVSEDDAKIFETLKEHLEKVSKAFAENIGK